LEVFEMKKTLFPLIAVLMAVVLFGACSKPASTSSSASAAASSGGTSAPSGGKTTVQFWAHIDPAFDAAYTKECDKFNASQSEIEVVPTYFPYDDFEAKIQTSLMARDAGADLYSCWGGWILDFPAEALSEAPADLTKDLVNDCYEPVLGALLKNGKYYGVPIEYNIEYGGMLVNKTRFDALGISYPTTWDDVFSVAKKYTIRRGDIFDLRGLDFCSGDSLATIFLSMIQCQNEQYWVNGKFSFSNAVAQKAWQTLADYITVDRINNLDSLTGSQGITDWQFMGTDQALMVLRGPWSIPNVASEYEKVFGKDFDYAAFPFYNGPVKAFPAETGWSMIVPQASKVADAAWKYVAYFFQPANLMQHDIDCGLVPPRKSVSQDPNYLKQVPYMAPIVQVLQYGKFIAPVNSDVLKNDINAVFIDYCQKTGGYANAAAALSALETKLNTDLKL